MPGTFSSHSASLGSDRPTATRSGLNPKPHVQPWRDARSLAPKQQIYRRRWKWSWVRQVIRWSATLRWDDHRRMSTDCHKLNSATIRFFRPICADTCPPFSRREYLAELIEVSPGHSCCLTICSHKRICHGLIASLCVVRDHRAQVWVMEANPFAHGGHVGLKLTTRPASVSRSRGY